MDASASNHDASPAVVATYTDVDAARAAITLLERHGVEGGAIELQVPGTDGTRLTNDAQRDADMGASGDVGKRAAIGVASGAVAGAVIGAVLGAAVSLAFDIYSPVALAIGGAVALGAAGWQLGFFYGGASGLSVSEAWGDTYAAGADPGAGVPRLAVHPVDEAAVDDVVQTLRGTGALSLRRSDGHGHLVDA